MVDLVKEKRNIVSLGTCTLYELNSDQNRESVAGLPDNSDIIECTVWGETKTFKVDDPQFLSLADQNTGLTYNRIHDAIASCDGFSLEDRKGQKYSQCHNSQNGYTRYEYVQHESKRVAYFADDWKVAELDLEEETPQHITLFFRDGTTLESSDGKRSIAYAAHTREPIAILNSPISFSKNMGAFPFRAVDANLQFFTTPEGFQSIWSYIGNLRDMIPATVAENKLAPSPIMLQKIRSGDIVAKPSMSFRPYVHQVDFLQERPVGSFDTSENLAKQKMDQGVTPQTTLVVRTKEIEKLNIAIGSPLFLLDDAGRVFPVDMAQEGALTTTLTIPNCNWSAE